MANTKTVFSRDNLRINLQSYAISTIISQSGLEVIKLEIMLKLKIKRNDWLLADMCPQATNHCTLKVKSEVLVYYSVTPIERASHF